MTIYHNIVYICVHCRKGSSFSGTSTADYQHVTLERPFFHHVLHSEIIGIVSVHLPSFFLQEVRSAASLDYIVGHICTGSGKFLERGGDVHGIIAFNETGIGPVEVGFLNEFVAVLPTGICSCKECGALAVGYRITYEAEFHSVDSFWRTAS